MTGEKRTETRMRCYNTLCIPCTYITPPLPACIVYDCREGHTGNTQSVIASHSCFYSFFTSHPYILSKYLQMFLFTSLYPFSAPTLSELKLIIFDCLIFVNCHCTNGHGVIIVGVIGSRFATL